MNNKRTFGGIAYFTAIAAFAIIAVLMIAGPVQSQQATKGQQPAPIRTMPFELGHPIPLKVQSSGVEWGGQTLHLLTLNSIRFKLDQPTNHLRAEIQAEVSSFDNVDYDISAAVFGTEGDLLGTARTQCQLQRSWKGTFMHGSKRTVSLDFGISLDYPRVTSFMVGVSNRKVSTPNEWQK